MQPNVHSSIIHNSQDMDATSASINRWMDKDMVYTYNGILLSYKKKKNKKLPFATTQMDLEGIMLSEVSQTEKDK